MSITYRKSDWTKAERAENLAKLAKVLRPGATVHTVLRHVSTSGMARDISPILIGAGGDVSHLAYWTAAALGRTYVESMGSGAVRVTGAGMDMGFDLVYSLARTLWPHGAPSGSDHARADGGYGLEHRWL